MTNTNHDINIHTNTMYNELSRYSLLLNWT